jgi:deoxyribonuclease-2
MIRQLFLILSIASSTWSQGCKSEDGSDIDWWVAIKGPRGTEYLYADVITPTLILSPYSMNDTDTGALAHTVSQLWTPGLSYTIWNDEPAPAAQNYNSSYGHTKGILTDTFWLIHSIPIFPAGPASTPEYQALGSNAWTYAQSAACFTISDSATLNTIGGLLQFYHPNVYDVGVTPSTSPAVRALAAGAVHKDPVCATATLSISSTSGVRMYAKTPAWNADLWSACVAPTESVDLWVESWLRGSEVGPVCNGPVWTTDVQEVDYGGGMTWSEYSDHGKWAVDTNGTVFCIGGINRMTTQYVRAGGAVCWNTTLANSFANAVSSAAQC